MSKELRTWILDNFDWWSDGHEKFTEVAIFLTGLGVEEEKIKTILEDCHSAVSGEYQ